MKQASSLFNWSLKNSALTEYDAFSKARLQIIYTILLFSILKSCMVLTIAWQHGQNFNVLRAGVCLLVYAVLVVMLHTKRLGTKSTTHVMVWMALLLIWSNVFITTQSINVITVQFIFMVILSSFYILSRNFAIIYSATSILPLVLLLIIGKDVLFTEAAPGMLPSPGYEILLILNFVTIIITHYFFKHAFALTITEKEQLNEKLVLVAKEANQATESKSDFLSTMSHELRTPLNSVIGISELLLKDSHTEEQKDNLRILRFSAMNLHSLINDILDYNKLGSEKLKLENIPVDLSELMSDVSSSLDFQAKQKNIGFTLHIDDTISDQFVITDPTRISQIIYNLAGNAIKFTVQGSVSIRMEVLGVRHNTLDIRFYIIDTGIGISEDKQEAIFEPFTQESTSTTRNFGGTGLGLAIVKRLLTLFNSHIHLKSAPGTGSTFSFDISFETKSKPEFVPAARAETPNDLASLQILIAEDNPVNRLLMTKVLSKWNNTPDFAINGQEAIDKIMLRNYDVVLMDLHMPVMNGYEASKAIRNIPDPLKANVKIIALTASVSANLGQKTTAAGMNDFMLKPFKLEDLYQRLITVSITPKSNLEA